MTDSAELADTLLYRNCKIHNNHHALALALSHISYKYKRIDRHQSALIPLFENHNRDK